MINFSTLQGLTIPEGVVTQIADASGRVLWSAVEKVVITLTGTIASGGNYVEYNGIKYTSTCTFEAVVGDTITVYCGTVPSSATIYLNGAQVSTGLASTTYVYTVVGNATINGSVSGSSTSMRANVYITEEMVEDVTSIVFRPAQDVEVDTSWTLYPSGSTTAYSLLSEEVADDGSTYITTSVAAGEKNTCVIGFECENLPNRIPTITGGSFYMRYSNGSDTTGGVRLFINDILYSDNQITADGIAKINEYVASNGKFPTFLMYAKFGNGGTKSQNVSITQAYIELTCGT